MTERVKNSRVPNAQISPVSSRGKRRVWLSEECTQQLSFLRQATNFQKPDAYSLVRTCPVIMNTVLSAGLPSLRSACSRILPSPTSVTKLPSVSVLAPITANYTGGPSEGLVDTAQSKLNASESRRSELLTSSDTLCEASVSC